MTAHHRRLTGSGMLLFFIALALLDSNLFPQLSGFPIALLLSLPLMIAGLLMVKAGWKMPPQPSGHYRLEGWPPATKVD
jgi:hypothetical protein